MHVCHVNLSAELGGGTLQTLALIEALGTRVQQSAVVQRGTPLHHALTDLAGLDIRPVRNSLWAAARASGGADLLHIHEGRSVTIGALRSLARGTPFVVVRGVWQPPNPSGLSRWRYERAAAVVPISTPIAEVMRAYSGRLKLTVIPDCVRPLDQDPKRSQALRASARGRLVVGHVGSLQDAVKGQSLIIEAARSLAASHPEVVFWLLGEGPDRAGLEQLAAGLDNVEFKGWADRMGDYYGAMDVFVFPSRKEGLGSALLEAMAFGLPVVAARVGGIPDLVSHEDNGLLIGSDSATELSAAVARLARDPALRQRLGAAGARRVRDYSPEQRAERYLALYAQVLGAGQV
jgi:glycosyltransferase involved in cell wall biosynthesis